MAKKENKENKDSFPELTVEQITILGQILMVVFNFVRKHKVAIGLGVFGLVSAILILSIGFFPALLIMLLVIMFGAYGFLVDKYGFEGANNAIKSFITGRSDQQ